MDLDKTAILSESQLVACDPGPEELLTCSAVF
jgi:hypothetical protein